MITKGKTKIFTSEKYTLNGEDITMDNKNKIITSNKNSILLDQDGNKVFLDNFEYSIDRNLFKSVGYVKIEDLNKNIYEFSQIYIDTKKKEILGTDTKSYLNQEEFKINEKNKPRIFANTINIKKEKAVLKKVCLHYATIEKMISVHPGQFNQGRCYTTILKKQFIMKMQ